jgi:hypothetical protein
MGGASEEPEGRELLVTLVRQQTAASACWQRAETMMRASAFRERLAEIGIVVTPDVAAAVMAAAMHLTSGSDEWGGDYRDALADIAALGLELFDG